MRCVFMEKRVYECPSTSKAKFDTLLKADPYAKVSFSRQGYLLKDGKTVNAEEGKCYVLIAGELEFFKWAEEQFKTIENVARAPKETEAKIIATIDSESGSAEEGLGAIFG